MSLYVETWKAIADTVGRSERWCRYMAKRDLDPLPVFKMGGITRLNLDDFEAWLDRQRERRIPPIAHRVQPEVDSREVPSLR